MKILLFGACGKMGKSVAEIAAAQGDRIVCGVDVRPSAMPFPVYTSVEKVTESADIVIDFSSCEGLAERLQYCEMRGIPIVLGTTGYNKQDLARVNATATRVPVFKTGNFSIGVNLLQLLVKKAAQVLGDDFDIEIIERHHNQKKDAPSGTALMLAESAATGRKRLCFGRHELVGKRSGDEIGIHAIRGGNLVGEHEVMFAGEDELITLSHSARSRKIFAAGALRAARWTYGQPAGLYGMNDLLSEYDF